MLWPCRRRRRRRCRRRRRRRRRRCRRRRRRRRRRRLWTNLVCSLTIVLVNRSLSNFDTMVPVKKKKVKFNYGG